MWKKLSLQFRLNALFALVLMLGLAINIGRLMLEAGPRVQAEDESVIRLAREFVETLVGDLKESPDPDAKLAGIVDSLPRLRHVSVTRTATMLQNPRLRRPAMPTRRPMTKLRRNGLSRSSAPSKPVSVSRSPSKEDRSAR